MFQARRYPGILIVLLAASVIGCSRQESTGPTPVLAPADLPPLVKSSPAPAEKSADTLKTSPAKSAPETASAAPKSSPTAAPTPAPSKTPEPAPKSSPAAASVKSENGLGVFKGKVTASGDVKTPPPLLKKGAMVQDGAVCAANDLPDESVVVGDGGALANVVIWARKTPAGYKAPPPPSEPATFDQKGCRFFPHVFVVRIGQPITYKNSDPFLHNVRTSPLRNDGLNTSIGPEKSIEVKLSREETIPFETKCDIHAFMKAWQLPVTNPFFAVTGSDGSFEIKDLPDGDYDFRIWHEKIGYIENSLKLSFAGGQIIEKNFSADAAKLNK